MAISVGTTIVRLVNEVLSEREVTVRNDGASAVFVSTDPQMVASGAQTFSVAVNASQDVTLSPGQSLFAICAAGQSASVEVV